MLGPLAFLLAGVVAGRFLFPEQWGGAIDPVISVALCVVVFCAGIDIGAKRLVFRKLRTYKAKVLLFPIAIALFSVLGAVVLGWVLHIPPNEAGAIGAGVGYYSLSSGLLTGLGGVELGSLAFTANVLREVFALLLTPFFARYWGHHTAIAPAGAASMDTVLGIIASSTDEETALFAMINGVILTMLVPILVPLIYQYL